MDSLGGTLCSCRTTDLYGVTGDRSQETILESENESRRKPLRPGDYPGSLKTRARGSHFGDTWQMLLTGRLQTLRETRAKGRDLVLLPVRKVTVHTGRKTQCSLAMRIEGLVCLAEPVSTDGLSSQDVREWTGLKRQPQIGVPEGGQHYTGAAGRTGPGSGA